MGLDQYAFRIEKSPRKKIQYWRKHNRLQGFMDMLWAEKGNTEEFNCRDLILTPADLNRLEEAINNDSLETTEGFFFGGDYPYTDEMKEEDLKFVNEARRIIAEGDDVAYHCWY